MLCFGCLFVFFFQAEDGIRDKLVTGVQTCALPISELAARVGVRLSRVPDRELGEREALPVEAALHRHRARDVLPTELEQDAPAALDFARIEQRDAEPPTGPAARIGDRGAGQAAVDAQALLEGGDRTLEITGVVERPALLEQRPVELVRAV